MSDAFIGREKELNDLNELYQQNRFQLFVLYGRRRVGKTTLLNEFCKDKDSIFYSAEQSNEKLNLEKFSALVFHFYGETSQIEIDIVANDNKDFLIGECKWRNEKLDVTILRQLKEKADIFHKNRENTWYVLFSKSGFTETVIEEAEKGKNILLVDVNRLMENR